MVNVGDHLPDFEVLNQNGKKINSSKFIGKKLVVFFYPQASTTTCTVEACHLNEHYSQLIKAGFQLVGVSGDSVKKQKNFHSKNGFSYDLLADENHEIINKFGVWKEKKTFGKTYMGIVRTTFLFDENGICIKVIDKVKSKEAAHQILEEN